MQTKALNKQKEPLELFREKCRERGISITPQRVAIYSVLIGNQAHPSAETIYNRVKITFPDISIDTIYRTLSTFSNMGLVDEVEGYGEVKRYDPELKQHHHFRCKKCNKIVDFHEKSFDNLKIPKAIKEKFSVSNIKVVAEGLCDECL
ncbi:MAG: transcriptional repressor [Sedimentisphaerales bacterium]|nr:transcriptional repressor [Sedimentisphaerales bacterium]